MIYTNRNCIKGKDLDLTAGMESQLLRIQHKRWFVFVDRISWEFTVSKNLHGFHRKMVFQFTFAVALKRKKKNTFNLFFFFNILFGVFRTSIKMKEIRWRREKWTYENNKTAAKDYSIKFRDFNERWGGINGFSRKIRLIG